MFHDLRLARLETTTFSLVYKSVFDSCWVLTLWRLPSMWQVLNFAEINQNLTWRILIENFMPNLEQLSFGISNIENLIISNLIISYESNRSNFPTYAKSSTEHLNPVNFIAYYRQIVQLSKFKYTAIFLYYAVIIV